MKLSKVKIKILPSNKIISVKRGANLLDALLDADVPIESLCGGKVTCGKCLVKLVKGNLGSDSYPTSILSEEQFKNGYRLACLSTVEEDVVISIPYTKTLQTNKLKAFLSVGQGNLNPSLKKIFIKPKEADLNNPVSDYELISKALKDTVGNGFKPFLTNLCVGRIYASPTNSNLHNLREIPFILRQSHYCSTAILYEDEFIALEEGNTTDRHYGVAFDIGTTTVAGVLYNLVKGEIILADAILNPQHSYGVDTISRINYAIQSDKNLNTLHSKIISGVNEIIDLLCGRANINSQDIYEVIITGNTTMTHLVLNLTPLGLSRIPFVPVIKSSVVVNTEDIGIKINKNGKVFVFPNIGGFVGGDTVAMVLTTDMMSSSEIKLAIDIGTNGETVLGNREKLLSCSNAAGPAFEGSQIKFGMRATEGAIESVIIENGDLKMKVIGDKAPMGICGSGLIDIVSTLLKLGIIDNSGKILNCRNAMRCVSKKIKKRIVEKSDGNEFILVYSDKSNQKRNRDRRRTSVPSSLKANIVLTQKDIRELQLAKGAIAAGIKILIKELKVNEDDIKQVYLSGAFGNYINIDSAVTIGLIPKRLRDRVKFIGNSASSGALMALINRDNKKKAEDISKFVKYVELGGRTDFQEEFANSMYFT